MRPLAVAALLALALPARAVLDKDFRVAVVDAGGGPVAGAFVVAREFVTVGRLHGTSTYCFRADAAPAEAPWTRMSLPGGHSEQLRNARATEAFAYVPGYCLARTADGAAASSRRHLPMGQADFPDELDASRDTTLRLVRSTQDPEERLVYLREVGAGLFCGAGWSARSRQSIDALAAAILGEADALPRNRYERALAARVRDALTIARTMPGGGETPAVASPMMLRAVPDTTSFARDFIVAAANSRVSWQDSRGMAVVAAPAHVQATRILAAPGPATPGSAAAAVSGGAAVARPGNAAGVGGAAVGRATPGNVAGVGGAAIGRATPGNAATAMGPAAPAGLAIHCRHGPVSACDLDERDAQGATAVGAAIARLRVDEVRLLLEAGADPSLPQRPFGPAPIESLLRHLVQLKPGTPETTAALEILGMLLPHPKVTLPAALKADLETEPGTWQLVREQPGAPLIQAQRDALRALAAREPRKPACPPLGWVQDYSLPTFRLRHP